MRSRTWSGPRLRLPVIVYSSVTAVLTAATAHSNGCASRTVGSHAPPVRVDASPLQFLTTFYTEMPPDASLSLGGHLKTGHTWPLQNRPTELNQNKSIYNPAMAVSASIFRKPARRGFILAKPGRRIWQRGDATRAPIQVRNGGAAQAAPLGSHSGGKR